MSTPRLFTTDELDGMERADLELIVDARGVDIKDGTGSDGNVVKADLIAAILADQDASGLNPAIEATTGPAWPEPTVGRFRVLAPAGWDGHPAGAEISVPLNESRTWMLTEGGILQQLAATSSRVADLEPTTPVPPAAPPNPKTKEK